MPNFEPAWPVRMCSCVSASTPGITRDQQARSAAQRCQPLGVLLVVEHDRADAGLERHLQLGLGLGVAVQVEPRGVEPGAQGEVQLAAGGDVAAEALLGEDAQDRGARERLRGEDDLAGAVVETAQRLGERARPRAEVVLRHHVRGRAELARQLARVAAADAEHAAATEESAGTRPRRLSTRGRRRAPCAPRRGDPPDPDRPAGHHHDRQHLRLGEARAARRRCGARTRRGSARRRRG